MTPNTAPQGVKKKPFRLSVTRAKGYLACPASWFFAEVLGLDQGPKPAAELGTKVHAILEDFARGKVTRRDIEFSATVDTLKPFAVAYRGLTHLEDTLKAADLAPGAKDLHVEDWVRDVVSLGTLGDVPFTGKVDLWWFDPRGVLHVLDHKTSSDPRKWGLSRQGVQRDLQILVYAYQIARRIGHTGPVMGHIIYYPTRNGHALRVDAVRLWTERDLVCAWEDLVEIAQEMAGTYLTEAPQKNPGHCQSYGGCPFQTACKGLPEMNMNPVDHALAALKPFPTPTTLQIERAAARARCTIEDLKAALSASTTPRPTAKTGLRADAHRASAPPSTNAVEMAERIRKYLASKVGVASATASSVEQAAATVGTTVETLVALAGLVPKDGGWALGPKPEPQAETGPEPKTEPAVVTTSVGKTDVEVIPMMAETVDVDTGVGSGLGHVPDEVTVPDPAVVDLASPEVAAVVALAEAAPGWPEGLEEAFTTRPAPPLEPKELQVFITILAEGLPRTMDSCHRVAKDQGLWTRMHTDRKARVLQAFRCWDDVGAEGETPALDAISSTLAHASRRAELAEAEVKSLKAEIERIDNLCDAKGSEVQTLTERCAYLEKEAEVIPLLEAEVERLKVTLRAAEKESQAGAEAEALKKVKVAWLKNAGETLDAFDLEHMDAPSFYPGELEAFFYSIRDSFGMHDQGCDCGTVLSTMLYGEATGRVRHWSSAQALGQEDAPAFPCSLESVPPRAVRAEQAKGETTPFGDPLPSVILVDAVPDSVSCPLRDVLDEFFVKVQLEKGVADVALLDYNKGFVLANAYFARALRDGWKAPTGNFTARTDEPYLRHFEHTLRRAGFSFVRGVR